MRIAASALLLVPVIARLTFHGKRNDDQVGACSVWLALGIGLALAFPLLLATDVPWGDVPTAWFGALIACAAVELWFAGYDMLSLAAWGAQKLPGRANIGVYFAIAVGWPLVTPTVWGEAFYQAAHI